MYRTNRPIVCCILTMNAINIFTRQMLVIIAGLLATVVLTGYFLYFKGASAVHQPPIIMAQDSVPAIFPNFSLKTLNGTPLETSQYKGKKIIVLNVASECGYTPQYADWQKFYEASQEFVVVIGFPSNDFGAQEPGSGEQIQQFCQKNYGVTFPVVEKVSVKGANQSPVYKWLSDPELNGWNKELPSWNFCKYLIDENGKLVRFFGSNIKPDHPEFLKALGM